MNDIARLILRLTLSIMLLFHGVHKIIHGISGVKHLVTNSSLPEFIAYGVYVGEVVMPILVALGLYARVASVVIALNMLFAIYLAYGSSLLELTKHGAPVFELPFLYFILSILVVLLGSGKYGINAK